MLPTISTIPPQRGALSRVEGNYFGRVIQISIFVRNFILMFASIFLNLLKKTSLIKYIMN